ncbi:acyltransferase [Photobacterium damselae]|uniref:acyltransferase n=1 Tax=Photobacterium damselae TaxID=38293 RepID=UPI00406914AF
MTKLISYFIFPFFIFYRALNNLNLYLNVKAELYRFIGCNVGDNVKIQKGAELNGCKNIKLGDNVFIGSNCVIVAYDEKVEIGDNTLIGASTKIISRTHRYDFSKDLYINEQGYINKAVNVGANVWIGFNCVILSGVTICNDSVIAAGSVVTKNITTPGVYGGVPAKFIKAIDYGKK